MKTINGWYTKQWLSSQLTFNPRDSKEKFVQLMRAIIGSRDLFKAEPCTTYNQGACNVILHMDRTNLH